jgi:hypothetical protein
MMVRTCLRAILGLGSDDDDDDTFPLSTESEIAGQKNPGGLLTVRGS